MKDKYCLYIGVIVVYSNLEFRSSTQCPYVSNNDDKFSINNLFHEN